MNVPEWLTTGLRYAVPILSALGIGAVGGNRLADTPEQLEAELTELRIQAGERTEMRLACNQQVERERQDVAACRAEVATFVERCVALIGGSE